MFSTAQEYDVFIIWMVESARSFYHFIPNCTLYIEMGNHAKMYHIHSVSIVPFEDISVHINIVMHVTLCIHLFKENLLFNTRTEDNHTDTQGYPSQITECRINFGK